MEDEKSWALQLLILQKHPSLRGMSVSTAAQFGVRRAKVLDSLIQELIYFRRLPHLASAAATKTVKGSHHAFPSRRNIRGV
jgi:hypothetical protein